MYGYREWIELVQAMPFLSLDYSRCLDMEKLDLDSNPKEKYEYGQGFLTQEQKQCQLVPDLRNGGLGQVIPWVTQVTPLFFKETFFLLFLAFCSFFSFLLFIFFCWLFYSILLCQQFKNYESLSLKLEFDYYKQQHDANKNNS